MALRIEDYGLIGDLQTAALVGTNGSLDWLCLPRFDSPACFAALVGSDQSGRWVISPQGTVRSSSRRYRGDTMVLETEFQTPEGTVRLVDFMPVRAEYPRVVRLVEGLDGGVPMKMDLTVRFDYGHIEPWIAEADGGLAALAGPDAVHLASNLPLQCEDLRRPLEFMVGKGERAEFVLTWHPCHEPVPAAVDPQQVLESTESWWQEWADASTYSGPWPEDVKRSVLTLKALTYEPTGGIVAAPTTSLPESLGSVRNWDYRYCWLRDACLTLNALMIAGYHDEAKSWRDWVLRAIAGDPDDLQIMYGIAGERRLSEYELDWLGGYEGSAPVRVGNAAAGQLQLDVYGEVIDAVYTARRLGMPGAPRGEQMTWHILNWLETHWRDPDDGIWEVRGERQHFVHSKVMAWVAVDRLVKLLAESKVDGPRTLMERLRAAIHDEVCARGYDSDRNTFTQYYGSGQLDASLLLIPRVGFLPPTDPRVVGTVEAVQRELVRDGFVMRYIPDEQAADALPPGEGAFLPCSFWLVDALALIGREEEALSLFERLLSLKNDLGLFAEEYDAAHARMVGNFPQAFTHLALVLSAATLAGAVRRRQEARPAVEA